MNKRIYWVIFLMVINLVSSGQQEKADIYDPAANAPAELQEAVEQAKTQDKHVLVQVGGNWCPWCIRLHQFNTSNPEIDSVINANYVKVMVNYSKENKNPDVLKRLDFPQRFGFPVLVILNGDGERIHTQSTVYLEKDKSYDKKRLVEFLKLWSPEALRPENYD